MDGSQGHQARVKSSLEKLNVPAWYKDRQERAERRQRRESGESVLSSRSLGAGAGWRCSSGRGWGGYKRGVETEKMCKDVLNISLVFT